MTEYCPETGPDGELCGVRADIVHSRHFSREPESSWETSAPHTVPVEDAREWLHKELHLDHDAGPGLELTEFRHLIHEYEMRRQRQLWNPPQVLTQAAPGSGPMMLRPCRCCRCTGGTVCLHQGHEGDGCFWRGPGR